MPRRHQITPRLGRYSLAAALLVVTCGGASHKTPNFVVKAPTPEIARQIGEQAEKLRASIALAWLGKELPDWRRPCTVEIKLTNGEAGGLTSFGFTDNGVSSQEMSLEGRLDRILASALPHEITHTIFAAFFGGPMPRWADEGASLLSEDQREIQRHERFVADSFAKNSTLPLFRLFTMEEYPDDLMGFYGQGYSVSRFLVEIGGRNRFLLFVRAAAEKGWDEAARNHYGLANCRELDRAWRSWYTVTRGAGQSTATLASLNGSQPRAATAQPGLAGRSLSEE